MMKIDKEMENTRWEKEEIRGGRDVEELKLRELRGIEQVCR